MLHCTAGSVVKLKVAMEMDNSRVSKLICHPHFYIPRLYVTVAVVLFQARQTPATTAFFDREPLEHCRWRHPAFPTHNELKLLGRLLRVFHLPVSSLQKTEEYNY